VRLAHRFTGDADDALDVLQETFAYFHRKFPGFRLTARLSTFFYPVVRNISLAIRRKRGRFLGDADASDVLPSISSSCPSEPGDLAQVLARLPVAQREVLLMRFVDGMSLDEIGVSLSIPLGTVKSRLHNALAALREDPKTRAYFQNE
jgi:RNA polymerase sigma-70 factor (ECF subfamily)